MSALKSAQGILLRRSQFLASNLLRIDLHALARLLGFMDVTGSPDDVELRRVTKLQLIGLTFFVIAVAAATLIAIASVEISTSDPSGWFGMGSAAESVSEPAPDRRYDNIVQRPIFSRGRRVISVIQPLPQGPPPSPAPPPRDREITLRGVFMDGGSAKAFLVSRENPLGTWLQIGQEVAGWRIVDVRPGQVELEAQGESLAIPLGARNDRK